MPFATCKSLSLWICLRVSLQESFSSRVSFLLPVLFGFCRFIMKGESRQKTLSLPSKSGGNVCRSQELTRLASDVSVENCEEMLNFAENALLNQRIGWTDEKHNLYLNNLEVSFVRKLHQSKCLLVPCSEKIKRDKSASQKRLINHASSYKFTLSQKCCGRNINPSTDEILLKACRWTKKGKRVMPLGSAAYLQHFCSNMQCGSEFNNLDQQEGTGQNFVDEDRHSDHDTETSAKRATTASVDIHNQDQNSVSCRRPKWNHSSQ